MSQNLYEKIRTYISLDENEERFIGSIFKPKLFAKGEHLLLAGDVCREAVFVLRASGAREDQNRRRG